LIDFTISPAVIPFSLKASIEKKFKAKTVTKVHWIANSSMLCFVVESRTNIQN